MVKLKKIVASLLLFGMVLSGIPAYAETDSAAPQPAAAQSVVILPTAPAGTPAVSVPEVSIPANSASTSEIIIPASSTSVAPPASSSATPPANSTVTSEETVPPASAPEDIIVAPDSTSALPQGELVDSDVADLGASPELLDANDEKLTAFMTRLYKSCFDREPDAAGLAAWVGYLKNGMSGTDVTMHFFHSQEFSNLNTIDTEFLNSLYYVVFNRAVDESGAESWIRAMGEDGLSRDWVLSNVLASPEFANVCRDYGIQQGAYKSTQPRDQNPQITKFVNRMYSVFLGRKGEEGGLNAWCGVFLNKTMNGANFAYELSRSQEFIGRNLDETQYINVLYNAAFGRDAESDGLAAWLSTFDKGTSREYVLSGIINSVEFKNVCDKYGVTQGYYKVTQPRDCYPLVAQYVANLYQNLLGRRGGETELNENVNKLRSGKTGAALTQEIVASTEFLMRGLSDSDCVNAFHLALFGRAASAVEMSTYTGYLLLNSREALLSLLGGSNEFSAFCNKLGVTPGKFSGSSTEIKGIDVSKYQNEKGAIDFNAVRAAGYEFVMVRAVSTNNVSIYEDPYFRQNVRAANAAGLKVGVYSLFYATNDAEALREMQYLFRAIDAMEAEGIRFAYPIAVDVEFNISHLSRAELTRLVQYELTIIEQRGYYPMLYSGANFMRNQLNLSQLQGYDIWEASYSSAPIFPKNPHIWQHGGGPVPGVPGNCDMNISYVDYNTKIRTTRNSYGNIWNHW
ncbi:MAG: DUF4214 domain-containing protein [Ruthenibacterium sp.]